MSGAYYNEIDPYAAAWLRNLIAAGHIAPGDVDERSIVDVRADDLRGYTQCHFFAGIGIWSYALRLAWWPDELAVWTGSCPCQPFSAAGARKGHEDERHLWPAWFRLIEESRPLVCFGEQVADGDGEAWLDDVGYDLESVGYAVGAVSAAACGFGAPHERQRMFFVADAGRAGDERGGRPGQAYGQARAPEGEASEREWSRDDAGDRSEAFELAHAEEVGFRQGREDDAGCIARTRPQRTRRGPSDNRSRSLGHAERDGLRSSRGPNADISDESGHGAVRGFWKNAIWLPCKDGRARPIEPGITPLAHGAPARVGRLRAYGNAIVAPVAAHFIRAYMSSLDIGGG